MLLSYLVHANKFFRVKIKSIIVFSNYIINLLQLLHHRNFSLNINGCLKLSNLLLLVAGAIAGRLTWHGTRLHLHLANQSHSVVSIRNGR